jgi:hypothetical protein
MPQAFGHGCLEWLCRKNFPPVYLFCNYHVFLGIHAPGIRAWMPRVALQKKLSTGVLVLRYTVPIELTGIPWDGISSEEEGDTESLTIL